MIDILVTFVALVLVCAVNASIFTASVLPISVGVLLSTLSTLIVLVIVLQLLDKWSKVK